MNHFWLDDIRRPPTATGWDWAKSYDEFIDYATTVAEPPELASLDHDLHDLHYEILREQILETEDDAALATLTASMPKNGLEVVNAMVGMNFLPQTVVVHTMNPVGRTNMVHALIAAGYRLVGTAVVPGAWSKSPRLVRN